MSDFDERLAAKTFNTPLYTLEITGKDIAQIEANASEIPTETPINIAFLGNETHQQRINAARTIRVCGFEPVPIISSRRLRSGADLDDLIGGLIQAASPRRFIFVGGDPAVPAGPYTDSLALLQSGVLERHAIRNVGIVGYPQGHPKIENDLLWDAMAWKIAYLRNAGCSVEITTQFGFDPDAIVRWIAELREAGVDIPVRIGVPGPADTGRLLRFARQFGVVTSAAMVRQYGLSLANPVLSVGPENFVDRLLFGLEGRQVGPILFHLYPFGGIADGVRWMNRFLERRSDHPFDI